MAPSPIRFPARGRRTQWSWVSGLLVLLFAAPAYSQSLGDLARQEQERKANEPSHSTHVYTNEDLAKPQILVPEDQARVQANKEKSKPASGEPATEAAGNETKESATPLGDVARHYRAIKEASKKNTPAPAPQRELPTQSFAYPRFVQPAVKSAVLPVPGPAPARIANHNAEVAAKVVRGEETTGGVRIQVQPGDTLWKLAKQHLGRGEDWMLVAGVNPQLSNPSRILAGTWVKLPDMRNSAPAPSLPTAFSAAPSPAAKAHSVLIGHGDTLWKIAEQYFGDGAAWPCVARANPRIKNSDLIFAGQTLTMPDDCVPVPSRGVKAVPASSQPSPRQ